MDKRIVILTGAGISAESGIKTFRASDGLWENHRVEDVATPEGFLRNPKLVYQFYNQRRQQLLVPEIKPNAAHLALARLQRELGKERVTIVTQNVDNLHERAGAEVIHMHGSLQQVFCQHCYRVSNWLNDCDETSACPGCGYVGLLRPHIVWFGEIPLFMDVIEERLQRATHFVAIGTSGAVYPAAEFVRIAQNYGAKTIEINLAPSVNAMLFAQGYYGEATLEVPRWVNAVLA